MNAQGLKRSVMRAARGLPRLLAALILIGVVFPAFQGWRRAQAQATLDLSVQKSHVGDFIIGGSGIYSIVTTNVGTQTVNGEVTISDSLPAGLTPIQAAGVDWNPCTINGQLVTCVYSNTLGIAPSAALPAVVVAVNVAQSAAPRVTNTATMSNANDANLVNNTSSDLTTIVSADLAVFKTVEPALPLEGETITYTVSVLSNGPSATSGVILTDTLPTGLTFGAASATQGGYAASNGAWSIGGLAFGQAVTLTMTATVNSGTHGLEIINATNGLHSDLYDYNSANNSASASLRVQSTRLIGAVTPIGSTTGIAAATVTITDSLSHVYTATTATDGSYSFTDTAATPLAAGNVSVRADKDGYQSSEKSAALVAGVDTRVDFQLGTSDLVVKKTDGKSTVLPGQTFTYTLAVTNTGTIAASGVLITDVLPAQLSYITDTLDLDHETPSTGVLVWELEDDLAAGESVTFKLRVKVADGLPSATYAVKNTLKAASATPEVDKSDNASEDTNTGSGSPNVSITLAVSPTSVRTAQNATYTIKVSNSGTAPVTEVTVTDTFSTFVDIVSATTTKGSASFSASQRKVTATVGTLASGGSATVAVVVKVNSSAKSNQTVANTAAVSYKFGGAVSSKNSATVNFSLVVSSSLPGTGGIELAQPQAESKAHLPALVSAVLLALTGAAALGYALWARSRRP
ncbi:MAG: hypothetical protein L0Z70_01170, partial [Chloroflexi bacterium]|nr:hypothetical protein [Chloroflexota bacterium]